MRRSSQERRKQYAAEVSQISYSQEYSKNWVTFLNNMEYSTYQEWVEKYSPYVNPEAATCYYALIGYYDVLGTRIMKGQIDAAYVTEFLVPLQPILVWEKSAPIIEEWRKRYNHQGMMYGFEYLVTEIRKKLPDLTTTMNPKREKLMKQNHT